MYSMGWSILSIPVLKYFCSFASTAMELYIFCSALHGVEIAVKNSNYLQDITTYYIYLLPVIYVFEF